MGIDTVRPEGTFSCFVNVATGRIRRAFNPTHTIEDVINFFSRHDPNTDHAEDIQTVVDLWTDEVVSTFRAGVAAQEAAQEAERILQKAEAETRQELLWAEEQAHIENTIRELLKQNVK